MVRIDARSGGVLASAQLSPDFEASAYAIAKGPKGVWVGSGSDIIKIDPSSHDVAVRWHYGGGINDLVVKGSSVWIVSSAETVARVSAISVRMTGEANLGEIPTAVTAGGGSIWVAAPAPYGPRAAIWRLDPTTARVTQTTQLGGTRGYPPALDVAFGAGAVWVASYDSGAVYRVDPATGTVVSTIKIGGRPSGIAYGANRVWVTVS